jgi:hypothetical protein
MLPHVLGRVEARPPISLPDGPYNPMDIRLRSQPDQERSFASAAHSDTPTAKLEIPELRLIV